MKFLSFMVFILFMSSTALAKKRACKAKYIVGGRTTAFISLGKVGGFLASKKKKCAELAQRNALSQIKKNKSILGLKGCETVEYYADTEVDGKRKSRDVRGRVALGNCSVGNDADKAVKTDPGGSSKAVCYAQYEYHGIRSLWKNYGKVGGFLANKKKKCLEKAKKGGGSFIQAEYDKACRTFHPRMNTRSSSRVSKSILDLPCGKSIELRVDTRVGGKTNSSDGKTRMSLRCCNKFVNP